MLTRGWKGRQVQEVANLTPLPPLHPMERGKAERKCARPALTPRSPLSIVWRGGHGERLSACDAATIFAKLTDFRIYVSTTPQAHLGALGTALPTFAV